MGSSEAGAGRVWILARRCLRGHYHSLQLTRRWQHAAYTAHRHHPRCHFHYRSLHSASNANAHAFPIRSSADIRASYLDYFRSHSHTVVPSASLIPSNDPTLLFTSAGMVQFKPYFLSHSLPPNSRLTSCQRCLRAGGKHNDLENVGFTARHLTFFEMLGNFAFFDYDKRHAIVLAWHYINSTLALPQSSLRVTVHYTDSEAYHIWREVTGWSDSEANERIVKMGDEDNYWSMGDVGPRGPCTEIYYDTGTTDADSRWLEIWNIVFMDSQRHADGTVEPLKGVCIDTGMGLERVASVLQGVRTNYDTDLFAPIVAQLKEIVFEHSRKNALSLSLSQSSLIKPPAVAELSFLTEWHGSVQHRLSPSFCVILDHCRSIVFMMLDGVRPSNTGRGYVLRRIVRRAITHAYQLGIQAPFLHQLYDSVSVTLSPVYPELAPRRSLIVSMIEDEERLFYQTLERGLAQLQKSMTDSGSDSRVLDGSSAFLLYDTFGFPLDLTEMILRGQQWTVYTPEFDRLMEQQKAQSRRGLGSSNVSGSDSTVDESLMSWASGGVVTAFTGYDTTTEPLSCIRAIEVIDPTTAYLAIDPCPFYPAGGGQVSDTGELVVSGSSEKFSVLEAKRVSDSIIALRVSGANLAALSVNDSVSAFVHTGRSRTASHHTATHLLHSALRQCLSGSITQCGSHVDNHRLRLDINYHRSLTPAQIAAIESLVNDWTLKGLTVRASSMHRIEAESRGAMALFTDKYGDVVRVVDIGAGSDSVSVSKELCGGTHVNNTRQCWPFRIVSESSIAAGVRRIEAVSGDACVELLNDIYQQTRAVASLIKSPINQLEENVQKLVKKEENGRLEIKRLTKRLAGNKGWKTMSEIFVNNSSSISVTIHSVPASDASTLADLKADAQALAQANPAVVHLLVCPQNAYCAIACHPKSATDASAADVWQRLATALSDGGENVGKGGGSANYAQGTLPKIQPAELFLQQIRRALGSHSASPQARPSRTVVSELQSLLSQQMKS